MLFLFKPIYVVPSATSELENKTCKNKFHMLGHQIPKIISLKFTRYTVHPPSERSTYRITLDILTHFNVKRRLTASFMLTFPNCLQVYARNNSD